MSYDLNKNFLIIYLYFFNVFRKIVLTVILIRAGLGFDFVVLRKLFFFVLRLVFVFCLVECLIVGVVFYFLMGLFWVWVFLLGWVDFIMLLMLIGLYGFNNYLEWLVYVVMEWNNLFLFICVMKLCLLWIV